MFSPQLGWKSLAVLCDSLSKLLGAGVDVRRAFAKSARKASDPRCALAVQHVVDGINEGGTVADGMRDQPGVFPNVMVDLVDVAEQTGMMPEIFEHLRNHYESNLKLRRTFVGQITFPLIQFVAAIFIVAFLIVVNGWVAQNSQGRPLDILGFGLFGPTGAVTWLTYVFGSVVVLFVCYQLLTRLLAGKALVHSLLLKVPVVGHCMQSFAIARFSWSFFLTQQTGMPIERSLEASLKATGNGAFVARIPDVQAAVRAGEELTLALADTGLFPEEYIEMVHVGETTGTVPETLERLFPQFEESARRSLAGLATTFSWGVRVLVGLFVAFFVFRVFSFYVGLINGLVNEI